MFGPTDLTRATRRTCALSAALAAVAGGVSWHSAGAVTFGAPVPSWIIALTLGVAFGLGEQWLLNVEFRRQAYSLTLAGLPLVVGVLTLPVADLVLARVLGAGAALIIQRVSAEKVVYNAASYAAEAAVVGLLVHTLLGSVDHLTVANAATVMAVVVACDQVMSCLVLGVIALHGGTLKPADVRDVLVPACALAVVSTVMSIGILLLLRAGVLGAAVFTVFGLTLLALYRAYLHAARRHQRLQQMHEFVTNKPPSGDSFTAVATHSLEQVRALLRASSASLVIVPADAEQSDVTTSGQRRARRALQLSVNDVDESALEETEVNLDWTAIRAIDDAEPLLAPRTTKDPAVRRWLTDTGHRDAIVVPMPAEGELCGTLTVANRLGETATFTPDDLTLLQTLVGHLAVAGGNALLMERLAHDANHDALTGLHNRAYLANRIETAVASRHAPPVTRAEDRHMLMLDLNRFKDVNDRFGHRAGDTLLKTVAERLLACVAELDAVVARLGGDEFAIFLPHTPLGTAQVLTLADRLVDAIAEPITIDEAVLTPETSIGITTCETTTHSHDMLRHADVAMYTAKTRRESIVVYHPDMDQGRIETLALLADLRTALRENTEQFCVFFQPKLDLDSRTIVSAEALVRWIHPIRGMVQPDQFIPLAETAGLIEQLTPLVLTGALRECRRWHAAGYPLTVAVNLSARSMSSPSLPTDIATALHAAGVPADALILEITESSILHDHQHTSAVLDQLAALGVTISIDDFGTGYSSLSYLQRLPATEIKIDRSFVFGLSSDTPDASRALISGIASLAASLGLRIVAEGVESAAVLQELHQLGCTVAQGYHLSRPLDGLAFFEWLKRPATHSATSHLRLVASDQLVASGPS